MSAEMSALAEQECLVCDVVRLITVLLSPNRPRHLVSRMLC